MRGLVLTSAPRAIPRFFNSFCDPSVCDIPDRKHPDGGGILDAAHRHRLDHMGIDRVGILAWPDCLCGTISVDHDRFDRWAIGGPPCQHKAYVLGVRSPVRPVSLVLALGHACNALTPNLLLVIMVYLGVVSGGILPARLTIASWLTPRSLLPSALAVNSTCFNLSRLVGPALAAGLLLVSSATVVFCLCVSGICGFRRSALLDQGYATSGHRVRTTPRLSQQLR